MSRAEQSQAGQRLTPEQLRKLLDRQYGNLSEKYRVMRRAEIRRAVRPKGALSWLGFRTRTP